MTDWREHLTIEEARRLDEIKAENRKLKDEHRRIYDRCRKRMVNSKTLGKTGSGAAENGGVR